jgi:hypothetical protein
LSFFYWEYKQETGHRKSLRFIYGYGYSHAGYRAMFASMVFCFSLYARDRAAANQLLAKSPDEDLYFGDV